MIELKSVINLILIVLTIKLIVTQWYPPIPKSKQAIISILLGTLMGYFLNPTKEGLVTGIIGSSFAFYGGELTQAFKGVAEDTQDMQKYRNNRRY